MNFRLTPQEYEELRSASVQRGERSVSEFTRTVVLGAARAGPGADRTVERRLRSLDQELARVSRTVVDLARWLKIGRGEAGPAGEEGLAGRDLSGGL